MLEKYIKKIDECLFAMSQVQGDLTEVVGQIYSFRNGVFLQDYRQRPIHNSWEVIGDPLWISDWAEAQTNKDNPFYFYDLPWFKGVLMDMGGKKVIHSSSLELIKKKT